MAKYTITEAGFGADLGAEKFLNIKCRKLNKKPDAVVVVATIKALKYHGGQLIEDIQKEDLISLEKGIHNLLKHIDNMKNKFGLNVIVAINKYNTDTIKEIKLLENNLKTQKIEMSLVEAWSKGGPGAFDLAKKLIKLCEKSYKFKYIYKLEDSIIKKIEKIAIQIYGAEKVEFSKEAIKQIKQIEKNEYKNMPICIAKTQYSLSDDPKNLLCEKPFKIEVKEIILKAGAGFIVAITGNIFTMPGLPKKPAAEKIDIDKNGNIIGIF